MARAKYTGLTISEPRAAAIQELQAKLGAPSMAAAVAVAVERTLRDELVGGVGLQAVADEEVRRAYEELQARRAS